jgi:hypothetical protein
MRIVAVSMVGNEADIIESFVRYNLRFVDALRMVLHRPVDGTGKILDALVAEGLPLRLGAPEHAGFRQGEELTRLAREAFDDGADFVLPLDADEFIKPPAPDYLRRALPAIPPGRFACHRWQNYAPDPGLIDRLDLPPLQRLTLRRQDEPPTPTYKVILTRDFMAADHRLLEGAHCVMQRDAAGGLSPCPMVELKALRLAHLPIRSQSQAVAKFRHALAAKAETAGAMSGAGGHWSAMAQVFAAGQPEPHQICALALSYPEVAGPGEGQWPVTTDPLPAPSLPLSFRPG